MKNIFKPLLPVFIMLFVMCGGSDDGPDTPPIETPPLGNITNYILSVTVTNKDGAIAELNNEAKTIMVNITKNHGDGSDIQLKLTLNENVSIFSPKMQEATYDLTMDASVWLEYNNKYIKYNIIKKEIKKEDINPSTIGWLPVNDYNPLPEGIAVYKSPSAMFNKSTIAYIAIIDMAVNSRKFKVLGTADSPAGKTPTQFYNETRYPVIINGGYFWYSANTNKLHHIGMLVQDSKTIVSNSSTSTRKDDKGKDAVFYPTRAVFSLSRSQSFACNWAYTSSGVTYAYPTPSPIKALHSPPAIPTASYPNGGWKLEPVQAIGAGPLLLYNGKIYDTWEEEIWDEIGGTNATSGNVPRSAIGVTENRKLIFFAGEGRNITPDTPGFSTSEVASILKSLGCVDAINLDGGGSSCMLINGKETIKPSGNGVQRSIVTAIAIQ